MKKLSVVIGFEIPDGKGTVTRAAGFDVGHHTLAEFRCAACGELHTGRWSVIKVGGPCQKCERTRACDGMKAHAEKMETFKRNDISEIVELRGAGVAARAFGVSAFLANCARNIWARRIMKRVPKVVQTEISNRVQAGESFEFVASGKLAKAFKLTVGAIKMIARRVWNTAKAIRTAAHTKMSLVQRVERGMELALDEAAANVDGVLTGAAIKFKKSGEIEGKFGFEAGNAWEGVSSAISSKFNDLVYRTRQFRRANSKKFAIRSKKEKLKARAEATRVLLMAGTYALECFAAEFAA